MSAFEWLNIGLGIIFVCLIVALSCTAVTDGISSVLGLRWRMLRKGIGGLLNDPKLLTSFYRNPIVKGLFEGRRLPSNIPAQAFSAFVLEQLFPESKPAALVRTKDILAKAQIGEGSKKSLLAFMASAEGKLDVFRANVEKWYDSTMETISAWYKGKARIISSDDCRHREYRYD